MWVSLCSILGPLFIFHIHPENRLSCHPHVAESQDLESSVLSLNADPDFQPRARHFQCPSGISIITGPKHYLTSPPNSSPPEFLILSTSTAKPETSELPSVLSLSRNLQFRLQYMSVLIIATTVQAYTISSLQNCNSIPVLGLYFLQFIL